MHRHRIDADRQPCLRDHGPELLECQSSGQVNGRNTASRNNFRRERGFARCRPCCHYWLEATLGKTGNYFCVTVNGPSLEHPARGRVDVDHSASQNAVRGEHFPYAVLRGCTWMKLEFAYSSRRLDAKYPQGIKMVLHCMAVAERRGRCQMTKRARPQLTRWTQGREAGYAELWTQTTGEPKPPPTVRQMDDEVVASCPQMGE